MDGEAFSEDVSDLRETTVEVEAYKVKVSDMLDAYREHRNREMEADAEDGEEDRLPPRVLMWLSPFIEMDVRE